MRRTAVIRKKYSKKLVLAISSLIKYNKHRCRNRSHGGFSQTLCSAATSSIAGLSFTTFIIISQMLLPYSKYVKILKFLTIFLFAYVVTAILAGVNWEHIFISSIIPL